MIRISYTEIARIGPFGLARQSPSGMLHLSWYNPKTRQVARPSLRTKDIATAIGKIQSLVDQGIDGDPRPHLKSAGPKTLRMVLETHRRVVAKLASAEAEAIHIEKILASDLADRTIATLVRRDWEDLRDLWLTEGLAIATVSRRLSTVRAALTRALANNDIPTFRKVPEFRTKNDIRSSLPKGMVITVAQLAALYDALDAPHLQIWMAWMLGTAARSRAILDLSDTSIETGPMLVHLNPAGRVQTNKWRPTLPVHAHLKPWLTEMPAGRLVTWRGGPVDSVKTGRRAAVQRAGLPPGVNSYSIRHSLGRYMLQQGVSHEQISVWLGHIAPPDSVETTLVYSPYAPEFLVDAKRATEKFVAEIAAHAKTPLLEPPPAVRVLWELRRQQDERDD